MKNRTDHATGVTFAHTRAYSTLQYRFLHVEERAIKFSIRLIRQIRLRPTSEEVIKEISSDGGAETAEKRRREKGDWKKKSEKRLKPKRREKKKRRERPTKTPAKAELLKSAQL